MKVLQVADHFPPQPGGVAVQAERLARRLGERGHNVHVVTVGRDAQTENRSAYTLHRAPLSLDRLPGVYQEGSPPFHPPWPDPDFRSVLASVVREQRPDVIHAHGWCVASASFLPQPRAPIVATLHDYGLLCPKKSLMRHGSVCATARGLRCVTCDSAAQPTPRRVALSAALGGIVPVIDRRVQRWLAVSDYVAERHTRRGIGLGRMTVLPPIVDLPPSGAPSQPADPPYILYAGPGDENRDKGRAQLLEAFSRLDQPGWRLVLVGGREPVMAPRVEDRGYLRGDALREAFRGSSFTVVPSLWPDPCPAVAVEAQGWGRPVVASEAGGLPDIVRDGVSGLLVPPGDVEALSRRLDQLIGDRDLRRRMSGVARGVVERFAESSVLEALESTYEELAAS